MKIRLAATLFITTLACLTTACRQRPTKLDIALEGPWILYLDSDFDAYGKKRSVLIAVAPKDATTAAMKKDDEMYHHIPQISTGDGFYIPDAGVYCLTFDNICARPGPRTLSKGGYGDVHPLALYYKPGSGNDVWDMIRKNGGVTLILPMPDSYSNDGVWRANFGPKWDGKGKDYTGNLEVTIGLILHYNHGPWGFALSSCIDPATVDNCVGPGPRVDHTYLQNYGTLRVMMRAPDTNDACDYHVRMAYMATMKLFDGTLKQNQPFGVIDPARRIDSNGYVHYEDDPLYWCLDNDPQKPPTKKSDSSEQDNDASITSMHPGATIHELIENIDKLMADVTEVIQREDDKDKEQGKIKAALKDNVLSPLQGANAAAQGLDEHFPRISQMRQIGSLVDYAADHWEALSSKLQLKAQLVSQAQGTGKNATDVSPKLTNGELLSITSQLFESSEEAEAANGGKNGSDCRAPIVMATAASQ